MTQAPTPGPLSAQQEEAIAFNLCSLHGFDPAFVTTQRDFAFAVIREYERARPSLAPTAPVEASGSERGEFVLVPRKAVRQMTMAGCDRLPAVDGVFGVAGALCSNVWDAMVEEGEKLASVSHPQPSGETREAYHAERIAEAMDEGDGFWKPCSGCQEGVDGYVSQKDYPFSPVFRCQPGGGCSECGGLGVLWDDTDYDAMAKAMVASMDEEDRADAGREAIRKVIHELWQMLDDGETGADGTVTIDQERYQEVSKAMDELEALVPDSAGPFWGGFPVNYFWDLK